MDKAVLEKWEVGGGWTEGIRNHRAKQGLNAMLLLLRDCIRRLFCRLPCVVECGVSLVFVFDCIGWRGKVG